MSLAFLILMVANVAVNENPGDRSSVSRSDVSGSDTDETAGHPRESSYATTTEMTTRSALGDGSPDS